MYKIKKAFFLVFLFTSIAYADVYLRLMPDYFIPVNSALDNAFEGSIGLDFAPFTVRGRDSIYFTAQGNAGLLRGVGLTGLYSMSGVVGAGYELRLADRFSLNLEGFGGIWSVPVSEGKNAGLSEGSSGILAGGRLGANFYLSPAITIGAFGGYKSYIYSPEPFMNPVEVGINLRYNFNKGIFAKSSVETKDFKIDNIFPVFYSHYNDHPFGQITYVNTEKNKISDVRVYVFIEKFMANPHVAAEFDSIAMNEEFSVDLTAFLNESILNQILASKTEVKVTVEYRSLGKKVEKEDLIEIQTLARNNMSWEEDERAAAFVSGKDAAANKFANIVRVIFRDKIDSASKTKNEQYAKAMFAAIKAYGINYVIDPASAFTDNSGTTAVDFLQFPYQTILYHGGDCDDLTILNCSLMEALGIDTAMITVPGHIYMAFDSGYAVEEANKITDGVYIVQDNKVWIPVEITLCQDTYALAKSTAIREWNKYPEERRLIPIKSAWNMYKPVIIPESDVEFEIPSRDKILKNF